MPPSTSAQARRDEPGRAVLPAGLTGLGNRFIEVLGRRLPRRHFAAEMARLMSEALRCRAVAVLAYDSRRGRLSLLADKGLPTDARDALGGGQDCSWDIPLHGLHNRRISVIEAAHQNPFVPRPLISLSPNGLCVACLPVYYDQEPVGTVLLFAAGARAFPDTQLQMLSQALRSCGRGLRDPDALAARSLRARVLEEPQPAVPAGDQHAGAVAAAQPTVEMALPQPSAVAPTEVQQAPDLVARIQFLEQEVTRAQADVERSTKVVQALTTSAHALARERDGFARQLDDAQRERGTEVAELRAQLATLEERLLAADSGRSRYQRAAEARHAAALQSLVNVQQERDALTERLRAVDATAAELNASVQSLGAERGQLSAQVDRLTGQVRADEEALRRLQALHADERTVLEADRDEWKQQTTTARAELAARAEQLLGLDRELRSAVVGREGLAAQLQATRQELERLAALAEELSGTAAQAETARANTVAETVALRRTAEDERAKHAETERVLRAEIAAVRDDADRLSTAAAALREQIAERTHTLAEREDQLASLRDAQEAARHAETKWQQTSASLRAEVATLTARLEQSAAEQQQGIEGRAALRAALAELRQRTNQADVAHATAVAQVQTEGAELRRQVEALSDERTELAQRLQQGHDERQSLTRQLAALQQRAQDLGELLGQRDAAIAAAAGERERSSAQLAEVSEQLRAAHAVLEQAQADHAQQGAAALAEQERHEAQLANVQAELVQRRERIDALDEELRAVRDELGRASGRHEDLGRTITELQRGGEATQLENVRLQEMLQEAQTTRLQIEERLHAELSAARAEVESLSASGAALRNELAQRDQLLAERERDVATVRAHAAELQETIQRLADEQAQLAAARVAETADLEALRVTVSDSQATVAQLENQRDAIERARSDTAHRLAETEQRLEELRTALRQREATADALAAERDDWKMAAVRAGADRDGLTRLNADLQRTVAELSGELDTTAKTSAELQERLAHAETVSTQEAQRAAQERQRASALAVQILQLEVALRSETARFAAADEELRRARAEIEELRQHSADRGALAHRASELQERLSVLEQELTALRENAADAERTHAVLSDARQVALDQKTRAVEAAEAEQARLRAIVEQLGVERDRLNAEFVDRLREVDAERATVQLLQATIAQLREERTRADADARDAAQRIAALHRELEEISGIARERNATLGTVTAEREQLVAQLAQVTAQLEAVEAAQRREAEERAALEAERQRWNEEATARGAQLERLSATAEEWQRSIEQLQTTQAAALTESAGLRQALEDERGRHRYTAETLQAALAALQAEVERQSADNTALQAELTATRRAVDDAATTHALALEQARTEVAELHRQIDELRSQVAERDTRLQAAVAQRDVFQENIRGVETAVAQLTVQRDELVRKTQDVLQQLEQERQCATDQLPSTPDTEFEPVLVVLAEEIARPETPLVIERSAPLGAVTDAAPDTVEPEPVASAASRPAKAGRPLGELVLVDEGARSDEAFQSLKGAGFEVAVIPPTDASVDELARRKIKCIMLNLGSGPRAWRMLRTLRERVGTRSVPILAYAMPPDVGAGFCFGRADFAVWPIDPPRLSERLSLLRPKLRRLMALTADIDGMGRLRSALSQANISTSIMLDGKQALEFAAIVEPEAAILHLSPACPSAPRTLAGFRAADATRDLPLLLLLDKVAAAAEDTFFAATVRQLLAKPTFQFTNLPEEIARVIG